jgi:hypothetical protein
MTLVQPLNVEAAREQFNRAQPFRHFATDSLLDPDFAREVSDAYPSFEEAWATGFGFKAVNEHLKVQVSSYQKFPLAVQRLADSLSSPQFMASLEEITGIRGLVWDDALDGGGMHLTASSGLLDVHVDFNFLERTQMFRRLNVLLYLNPVWEESWGGTLELWDRDVRVRHHQFAPRLNRCVLFETSEISFHGVTAVTSPAGVPRKSFAAYYYTREPPPGWSGTPHSTIFKARPDEYLKKYVLMPKERAQRALLSSAHAAKRSLGQLLRKG